MTCYSYYPNTSSSMFFVKEYLSNQNCFVLNIFNTTLIVITLIPVWHETLIVMSLFFSLNKLRQSVQDDANPRIHQLSYFH